MQLSLMFFSSDSAELDPYYLMLEASQLADSNSFAAVWTPERHFDPFGGLFPNPAITSAAIAAVTKNVQVRSGSLVSPLHDVIRIAEEWAMVDQLSNGRAAVSFGSGWNVNDFVFFPDRYHDRRAIMFHQIEAVRELWRTGTITRENSLGKRVSLNVFPRPLQEAIPIWVTSSGNVETFKDAGRIGANVLTHMAFQTLDALQNKIAAYRAARAGAGMNPHSGIVTLMLHTFLGADTASVKERVKPHLGQYLRAAVELETAAAGGGGSISGGLKMGIEEMPEDIIEELVDVAFERYFETASCMGSVENACRRLRTFAGVGVNEVACLIDFGIETASVLASLEYLTEVRPRVTTF